MQQYGSSPTHGKRVFEMKINWQDDLNVDHIYVQS